MSNVSACQAAGQSVIVLHGLLMNRYAMLPLVMRLRAAGFAAHAYSYHSRGQDIEAHLALLRRRLERLPDDAREASAGAGPAIHFVGHSMGGVVALKLLERLPQRVRVGRVVLLGTPLADCSAARAAEAIPAGRWLMGRSIGLWQGGYPLSIPEGICAGSIAGTRPVGLGALTMRLPGPYDGVVQVAETRLPGLADHLVLPVSHSGMLVARSVAQQCIAFLRDGHFVHQGLSKLPWEALKNRQT